MRKFSLLAILILPFSGLFSQSIRQNIHPRKKCYSTEYLKELQKQNPKAETDADFENWMNRKVLERKRNPSQNAIINYGPLPIVFHVIHTGQAVGVKYNVSQALIQAQVLQLNKDYANLSGSPYAVSSPTGLQFCLAQKDPNGATLAEPGIDRVNVTGKGVGLPPYTEANFDSKVKPATYWDPAEYINVWLTEFTVDEGILGYATFPSFSTLSGLDNAETDSKAGVVIDYISVGSVGAPSSICTSQNPYRNGRTLTHELGHYFGLRHIWGDGLCATDYCGDTPSHEDANYGAPVHPKSNGCGTADEMFENFMDYTDDGLMNTFTLNQAERMQIVMLNSNRRTELPTSSAGCAGISGTSKIGFAPCKATLSVSEKSKEIVSCPNYTDVKLYLNIEDKATGNATLNFSTSGTATNGTDFQIMNPSINIVAGESFKQVIVRIFDDGIQEGDETLNVSYTITGTGVVASGSLPQIFKLTIVDDDDITIGQNTSTLYSEDFGTTGGDLPAGWSLLDNGDDPTNTWVVSTNGGSGTTGQSLHVTSNSTTKPLSYNVSQPSIQIAQTPLIDGGGFKNVNLSFKYKVAGEQDGDGVFDFGKAAVSTIDDDITLLDIPGAAKLVGNYNGVMSTVTATKNVPIPYTLYQGNLFYINYYWENDNVFGTQPPLVIDDIVVTGSNTKVESQLNQGKEINVAATETNFIVSKEDEEIIASISNSAGNISCLNATIQQAGNGQVDISTNTGTYKRSEKVIKLSPASANNNSYTLTLYYTTAELASWASINTLKVMKVQDGVSLGSVLTGGNSILLTPVVNDKRAADGYASFTVTTTGFSQFFLVASNTTLPLQLLSFNASPYNNSAALQWNTSNEINNKGFDIERSLDGTHFSSTGFVPGKGQTSTGADYGYIWYDRNLQKGISYFYRLKQTDFNGNISYSVVRIVKLNGESNPVIVYPNPVKDITHIITGKTITASVKLLDMNGKKVWSMPKQTIVSNVDVPMKILPAGVYMLSILQDNAEQTFKIIKE